MRKRRRGSCLKCQGFISHSPCPHHSERSCLSCRPWIILISGEALRLLVGLCCQEELETWQVRVTQLLGPRSLLLQPKMSTPKPRLSWESCISLGLRHLLLEPG